MKRLGTPEEVADVVRELKQVLKGTGAKMRVRLMTTADMVESITDEADRCTCLGAVEGLCDRCGKPWDPPYVRSNDVPGFSRLCSKCAVRDFRTLDEVRKLAATPKGGRS